MPKLIKTDDGTSMTISEMLKSIERWVNFMKLYFFHSLTWNTFYSYNPTHFQFLEKYVQEQAKENTYDIDANLAVLKFYQFNPQALNLSITHLILLKALTNLPFSDFVLCKYLLLPSQMKDDTVKEIIYIADILEQCDFVLFWQTVQNKGELFEKITGFYVS